MIIELKINIRYVLANISSLKIENKLTIEKENETDSLLNYFDYR